MSFTMATIDIAINGSASHFYQIYGSIKGVLFFRSEGCEGLETRRACFKIGIRQLWDNWVRGWKGEYRNHSMLAFFSTKV